MNFNVVQVPMGIAVAMPSLTRKIFGHPCGIHRIMSSPLSNFPLVPSGCAESPPGTRPVKHRFPLRSPSLSRSACAKRDTTILPYRSPKWPGEVLGRLCPKPEESPHRGQLHHSRGEQRLVETYAVLGFRAWWCADHQPLGSTHSWPARGARKNRRKDSRELFRRDHRFNCTGSRVRFLFAFGLACPKRCS